MPTWRPRTGRLDRTQRLRRYWDKHARSYDRQMAFFERVLFGDGRQWVCAQAAGDTLEVAIGSGRNLAFYPHGIRLVGIDFSPQMLQLAQQQAEQLGRQVDLRLGDAQALDLPDASFDTVVCTLSLCAIPRGPPGYRRDAAGSATRRATAASGPRGRQTTTRAGGPVAAGTGQHPPGGRAPAAAAADTSSG
jgi:SAM-dependent methyltransferase